MDILIQALTYINLNAILALLLLRPLGYLWGPSLD